jgi:prepilin-type processing-associated H-X9-DG protein
MMAIGDTFGGGVFFGRGHLDNRELAIRFARHQGSLDVVFCDAHVESPTLGFLFTNTNDAALVRWNRDDLPHRDRL